MKTQTIITGQELPLSEETLEVARREALRTNRPLSAVLTQWLLEKAEAIRAAAQAN